jgi:C4-dicarboxylate transporter
MQYNLKQLYELKGKFRKLEEEKRKIESTFKNQLETILLAAFAFVAGLSWREVINSVIDYVFPLNKDTIVAKFLYAIVVTFFLTLTGLYVVRFINKGSHKEDIKKGDKIS